MGMFAFRLTLLFCSLTIYKSLYAASVLENSSDLWRNWLLNENEEIPSQQGPPLSRRITPKSVFIAPIFDKCPSGMRLDDMGKCVKIVRIDKWENLVNKLNAAFALTSPKPIATPNETTTTARIPISTSTTMTSTTTTTTTITTTTITPHISTESDMPSSTLFTKENEQPNNITYIPAADISGPLQLSIPLNSKNSSGEETDDDSLPPFVRSNLTSSTNESGLTTTTEMESPIEFPSHKYDLADTTISPQLDVTFSTMYPDTNTAESVGSILPDVEYDTEMTTESTTLSDFSTETPSLPKRYDIRRRPGQQQQVTGKPERTFFTSTRPELLNEPKLTVTPVANLIYSYTSGDILKVPVRFPEFAQRNKSSTDRAVPNRNGAFSANNISDINNTTSTVSDSISNSNKFILSSSSAKSDLYQKLPAGGKMRPKCDPLTGYGDCTPPSKLDSLSGSDKISYHLNQNRGSAPPVTTIIRFPGMYTKGTSMVRFPSGGNGGGIGDQQFKSPSNVGETLTFPEVEVGAASRYWDSNRYPASYWNPWDGSKPHFVRIWPSNVGASVTTTYNLGSDVNYNYRSQADYS